MKTSISPLSIWTGQDTTIWRFGLREDPPDAGLERQQFRGLVELLEHRGEERSVFCHSAVLWPKIESMGASAHQPHARRRERCATAGLHARRRRGLDYARDAPDPGSFPYTRGLYPDGYRGKLWTMRQFAGFGTPEDTNARYRALLAAGGTGLSVAFDLPTLMGRDPDDELALGEVGKCGVSVASLADMEALFAGIDLGAVSTSMTINGPASMLFAMYLVVAERQGVAWPRLNGTLQNDILKEFIAQKEYIYPPRPSMRLVTDTLAFCTAQVPRWNSISVSGYHIREAGATAAQELAFTLRDGIEYVQARHRRRPGGGRFAPRISFFFNAQNDLLEEVAKFRAARRLWARVMRDRFKAPGAEVVAAALPCADRRRVADGAAAV